MDSEAKKLRLWADRGDRTDPDDASLNPTLNRLVGWTAIFSSSGGRTPRRRVMNQILREITGFCLETMQRGIPEWDNEIDYRQYAIVQRNGDLWKGESASGPNNGGAVDPATPAQSTWSRISTAASRTVPDAPDAPTAVVGNGYIEWRWHCPRDRGAAVTAFTFQWRRQGQGWIDANKIAIMPSSAYHRLAGLTNGQVYEARVLATNSEGDSAWSATGSATPVAGLPAQVLGLTASPRDASLLLEFPAPDDGGSAIQGYHVQWKSGSQGFSSTRQRTTTGSPYTLTGLVNGTSYDVRVRAYNSVGNGPWSDTASAIRPSGSQRTFSASGSFSWPWNTPNGKAFLLGGGGGGGTASPVQRFARNGSPGGDTTLVYGATTLRARGGVGGRGGYWLSPFTGAPSDRSTAGNGGDGGTVPGRSAVSGFNGEAIQADLSGLTSGTTITINVGAGGAGGSGDSGSGPGQNGGAGFAVVVPVY